MDHIDPSTKARDENGHTIKCMAYLSFSDLESELEKCACVCMRCHRIRTAKTLHERGRGNMSDHLYKNMMFVNNFKNFYGCQVCGYNNPEFPSALDFDHIDPKTKTSSISQMMTKPFEEVVAEVSKCRVLCANCHYAVTHLQRRHPEEDCFAFIRSLYHPSS